MSKRAWASWVATLLLAAGCSNFDSAHDEFCALRPDICGTGTGSSLNPGGTFGGGPTGGGSAGCTFTFNSDDIYLYGDINTSDKAFSTVSNPESVCVGFPVTASAFSVNAFGGQLLYVPSVPEAGRSFVADSYTYNTSLKSWYYPSDPQANDAVLNTPSCSDLTAIAVDPEGGLAYRCYSDQTWHFPNGKALASITLYGLGHSGQKLLFDAGSYFSDANDNRTPIAAFSLLNALAVHSSSGGGFAVAVAQGSSDVLWTVSASGQASQAGTYGALPANVTLDAIKPALDRNTNLYRVGHYSGGAKTGQVVVKRSVSSASQIVYEAANAPTGSNDVSATPLHLYNTDIQALYAAP